MATFGTFTAGQVLTASELNAAGTYTAYTPTWTNLTVGNGTNAFRYCQFNKLVHVLGRFTWGTTTSASGIFRFTLPVTAKSTDGLIGFGRALDAGVAGYPMPFEAVTTSQMQCLIMDLAGGYSRFIGTAATAPFVWGNTDVIEINFVYEAA